MCWGRWGWISEYRGNGALEWRAGLRIGVIGGGASALCFGK